MATTHKMASAAAPCRDAASSKMGSYFCAGPKVLFSLFCLVSVAEAQWRLELAGGAVHNFTTKLKIESENAMLRLNADYETKPFRGPFYYSVRVSRGRWEAELIHHKLYLKNTGLSIRRFSVTHGYNLGMLNHTWEIRRILVRVGAGIVVAHPETVIAGIVSEPGYELTGPAFQAGIGKRLALSEHFFVVLEGKFTAAIARFRIEGANVNAPNVALHGIFGLGYKF